MAYSNKILYTYLKFHEYTLEHLAFAANVPLHKVQLAYNGYAVLTRTELDRLCEKLIIPPIDRTRLRELIQSPEGSW